VTPFRSRDSLAAWLAEFDEFGYPAAIPARVIEQDGSDGANPGLVAVQLSSGLDVYIQPDVPGGTRWLVTLDAREDATELSPAEVTRLSAELATVAALCAFLEQKSLAADDG
jgi:hypothetical protein